MEGVVSFYICEKRSLMITSSIALSRSSAMAAGKYGGEQH
jgi:hypothetical protein